MAAIDTRIPVVTPTETLRFWTMVDLAPGQGPKGECWEWRGLRFPRTQYGRFHSGKRPFRAHRLAYFFCYGDWPDLLICHECDNPPCCRPDHLFAGTSAQNQTDAKNKGRIMAGDRHYLRRDPCRVQGEKHPRARLNAEIVRELRRLYATGSYTYTQLTKTYEHLGISWIGIYLAVRGFSWRHVK